MANKKVHKKEEVPGFTFIKTKGGISKYVVRSNSLTVLYKNIPDTGVVTTNITYKVGSGDEQAGETGLAHMLEHMLFKTTKQDLTRKIDSSSMQFEREVGCLLNANTSNDRTTYFFSYPAKHFARAILIEAERMYDVILSNKEFVPERSNVLSEFDMYFGDPYFALSTQMSCSAFHSHPYGHEVIGFREDIERYTPEKLIRFYKNYYRCDNATITIVGDISLHNALTEIKRHFGHLQNPSTPIPRHDVVEPIQEGLRRVSITRESNTNLLALGVRQAGFPSQLWVETSVLFSALAGGADSILHKRLVDTGLASSVEAHVPATKETNLGLLFITLAPGQTHEDVERIVMETIKNLTMKDVTKLLKKIVQSALTSELFAQESSVRIAMDLTEYISANAWEQHSETEAMLRIITPKRLIDVKNTLFVEEQMTIGSFKGTN